MRYLAGALNLPFMAIRSMLGSDILKYNKRIKTIDDPYEGKPVALVPAAKPDVAIIHVQRADVMGNAQVWGFTGNDENKVRAAKHTIITCEEIVSSEEIRRNANLTIIPFYCVDAVVQVPTGVTHSPATATMLTMCSSAGSITRPAAPAMGSCNGWIPMYTDVRTTGTTVRRWAGTGCVN